MCSRHAEPGAGDPAQGLADAIALLENAGFYVYPDARSLVPKCIACAEPALSGDVYCKGHARLSDYRVTDETHWASND